MVISFLLCLAAAAATAGAEVPLYKQAGAPIPQRVADLLQRMTVEEMIAQVAHRDSGLSGHAIIEQYGNTSIGGVTVPDCLYSPSNNTAEATLAARNALQVHMMTQSRLGIPVSFSQEGLHSGALFGTVFPMPLLTACSWNDSLAEAIGGVLAYEARGSGVDNPWSPVVNMWQDDRFGRYQEGFSPDPTITSHFGRSIVLGVQGGAGDQDSYLPGGFNDSCWSTAKHFAGYGSAAGGLNGAPFVLNNRTLFEVYLRPWRAMAAVGLRGLMPSHNTVLDVPMHANAWLINDVMRGEFGFGNGASVSDCNDIAVLTFFEVAENNTRAAAFGINAGVDLDLQCGLSGQFFTYYDQIPAALALNLTSLAALQTLVGHVLTQKFAAGLFDIPPEAPASGLARLDAPAHRALAYEAAAQSIVLLQNLNGTLPLPLQQGGGKTVALIGPQLSSRANMLGSYTLDPGTISVPLLPEAFAATFPGVSFTSSPGCNIDGDPGLELIPAAVAAALAADYAVVAVGDSLASCGEWLDRDSLDLPGGQLALLSALVNATAAMARPTPIVVVLINGRAASFGPANALLASFAAVVEAWRPGEEGAQAIADIIGGRVNPSGKLVNQWAQHVGQMASGAQPFLARRVGKWLANNRSAPDPTDGREVDPYVATAYSSLPLFRFGHGLSYTAYEYKSINLALASEEEGVRRRPFSGRGRQGYVDALATTVLTATVSLCNTGAVDGTEIVQIYARNPVGASALGIVPFWKRLVGYGRIFLAAGACDALQVPVIADDLASYDDNMVLAVIPGTYIISAGGRSDQDTLQQAIAL